MTLPVCPTTRSRATVQSVLAILTRLGTTLSAEEQAAYAECISDAAAGALGLDRNPQEVFDEYARVVEAYVPALLAHKLTGYGPLRVHACLELMLTMVPRLAAHDDSATTASAASAGVAHIAPLTRMQRRLAVRAVRNLVSNDPEALRRIADATRDTTRTGRIGALQRLAVEVQYVRERKPARVLDDAGLTAAVLDGLVSTAHAATSARQRARTQRQTTQAIRADLVVPCGRLLFELRTLLASARDSRAFDGTIPSVTSYLVSRGAVKSAAIVAPPAPVAPTPAPR